ncbi:MAG: HupE/UreJ family protein [Alphaproteobacteria bacterium]|nr:HupE/UreJ family protein [Alphaproteobacteria bacterium]
MVDRRILAAGAAALTALVATGASAHPGHGVEASIASGFVHPFGGIDHILAMIGVGLWGAQIGGRALWQLPLAFVAALLVGALVGLGGAGLPAMEIGIAGSVAVLGLAVLFGAKVPAWVGFGVAALFGLFHGQAHGVEMPVAGSAASYIIGMVAATLVLHAVGATLGLAARRSELRLVLRFGGAAIAVVGGLMLAGVA